MAIDLLATTSIIDAIAVANVEAVSRAKPPNRVLNKSRKRRRISGIEGASVDLRGDRPDNVGTTAAGIAAGAVAVHHVAIIKNTGAMQKIMDQRVDGNHFGARFEPVPTVGEAEHQAG